jgi:hypothetical protein
MSTETRGPWGWILRLLVVVVLLLAGWAVVNAYRGQQAALEAADVIRAEREAAGELAEELRDSLTRVQERADSALGALAQSRNRADSLEAIEAVRAAALAQKAEETGQTVVDAIEHAKETSEGPALTHLDSASVRLERHLDDDRETVAAFRAQIAALSLSRATADSTSMVWRGRALTAEAALEARELECQLCLQEVELLRQATSPGIWGRIKGNLNLAGVAAGVGLLLGLIAS